MSINVKSAVFVATPQAAHLTDLLFFKMLSQFVLHCLLRTGEQACAAVADINLFSLIFWLGEIIERRRAIHIRIADEKFIRQFLRGFLIRRAIFLCQIGDALEEIIGQALPFSSG